MPTTQSKETNQFRCEFCGRHFNTAGELANHSPECRAAFEATGKGAPKPTREEGEDRDWVSTP